MVADRELGRHVRYPEARPFEPLLTLMKLMGALAESIGDSTGCCRHQQQANFKPVNPDDGSWKITQCDGQTLTAKGLLRSRSSASRNIICWTVRQE